MTLAGEIATCKADKLTQAAQRDELYRQARQWWERAAEKDDWNASAQLGQMYEKGLGGLRKNEEEAEKRYKEGVNHGNELSMFFYGLLIDRRGWHAEARRLISQAAMAGIPSAIRWINGEHQ
jgi:TPR repeat protein